MPKITNTKTNESINVEENSPIQNACEKLGVPFSCEEGTCGTCMIDIVSGEENLSELTEEERDLARDKTHRLACQCKIKNGNVEIKF
ncbi:MAG TPA: 2Fe-2S iron-sulfur cluster-binding protein [Candidatus Nanoarchaeia archaeon]|nr:2Fe-2S iron-sulfur cluster-binding protein [Candidatus Nanoarchaeia archaeon]